jgi:Putative restriction endonuclease
MLVSIPKIDHLRSQLRLTKKGDRLMDVFEMVQTPASPLTLDKFLQIPETEPASEFIDGQIFQKSMPQGQHSRLQRKLLDRINQIA